MVQEWSHVNQVDEEVDMKKLTEVEKTRKWRVFAGAHAKIQEGDQEHENECPANVVYQRKKRRHEWRWLFQTQKD